MRVGSFARIGSAFYVVISAFRTVYLRLFSSAGDRRALDRSRSRRQLAGFNSASSIKMTGEISLDNLTAEDFGSSPTLPPNSGSGPRRKKFTSMEEATSADQRNRNQSNSALSDALLAELKGL